MSRKSSRIQTKVLEEPVVEKVLKPVKKEKKEKKKKESSSCYMLLYKYNEDVIIPIYIDETLGIKFIKDINLVKDIEINNPYYPVATLQHSQKCCNEVYNYMSAMNSVIYPELANQVISKLSGTETEIKTEINISKKVIPIKTCVFDFGWDMDELTKVSELTDEDINDFYESDDNNDNYDEEEYGYNFKRF